MNTHNNPNDGFVEEDKMVKQLNNKCYGELNDNLKKLVNELFGYVADDETLTCELIPGFAKPDFVIEYCGIKRFISMKSGNATIMHTGDIENFVNVLREFEISEATIETILRFFYGDGTTDGSGKESQHFHELIDRMQEEIDEANRELNGDYRTVIGLFNRFVFQGLNPDLPDADALYHGDYKRGVMITKQQINSNLKRKSYKGLYSLHIGPLIIRPHSRRYNKSFREEDANRVVLDWRFFLDDVEYIHDHFYNPNKNKK